MTNKKNLIVLNFLMVKKIINMKYKISILFISLFTISCIPSLVKRDVNKAVPKMYDSTRVDTTNAAKLKWKQFFTDPDLIALIDTALKHNQQFNIVLQDVIIANNQVRARKGMYLPFVRLFAGAGIDKVRKYTTLGALESNRNVEIRPGKPIPENLPSFLFGANVSWQIDIWKQLRNAKKSALYNYFATTEGKNYTATLLIAEMAHNYYELLALDNQLTILKANIEIQTNALEIITLQKQAGTVTELAVRRFEAEVAKNKSRQFSIQQKIVETENRINFLLGRFPQPIKRNPELFNQLNPLPLATGVPSQLLQNRPDIKQAEQALTATKLDVKVAKANFYPNLNLTANLGYEAFSMRYLLTTPESMLYNLAGGLVAPLINRNAIKADYLNANARQIQAVYNYEQTVINAYTEVVNNQNNIKNLADSYDFKSKQVAALTRSIDISISLFKSALADYVEILLTQRDAIEAKMEMVETKKQQMNAQVKMYQVLGGGVE